MTDPGFSSQPGCHDLSTPIFDPSDRSESEITSYKPHEGSQGTRVNIYLRTSHDLLAAPSSLNLSFGSQLTSCSVQELTAPGAALKQYAIAAEAPSFHSTGHPAFRVPMRLVMDTGNPQGPAAVEVGAFRYNVQPPPESYTEDSRKRKVSISSDEDGPRSSKRSETQLRIHDNNAASFNFNAANASPYSPFLPTPTSASVYNSRYQQTASPRSVGHQYSTSATSQTSIAAPSPHTPSWSPSFATVNPPNRVPQQPMTPAPRPSAGNSPGKASNPPLIRTSTLVQSPNAVSAPGKPPMGTHAFNPYAMYPSKAVLNLNGDLDSMSDHWSMEEWDTKRRLVLFTRSQSGSTIQADFKPVSPEDRPPNSICISCIWWEERKECFVTSVDTIFLLESLVAVRFTVEEKNRIRRNLEGFRPLTVSKAKPDSEEFFKIIMGFPTPKPRNIEKDVKVFPWKILKHALKKIIGKYVSFSWSPSIMEKG